MISKILPHLYVVSNYSNSFLVEFKDHLTLIDAGMDKSAKEILSAIKEVGKEPRAVLITHGHLDHLNGLASLKENYPKLAVASAPEERRAVEGKEMLLPRGWKGFIFNFLSIFMRYKGVEVGIELKGKKFDGFRVIKTPGHTKGSLSFLLPGEGLLFCGDLVINKEGKLSLPPDEFNSDKEELIKSVEKVARLRFDFLLPGHGKPLLENAKARLKEFLATL